MALRIQKTLSSTVLLAYILNGCAGIEADVRAGQDHLENRQYTEAALAFSQALEEDPTFFDALLGLGKAMLHQGQFEKADKALSAAQKIKETEDLWATFAILRQTQERYDDAVDFYKRALATLPEDAELRYRLGQTYLALEQHEDAADAFSVAVELEPQLVEAWVQLAEALVGLGRYSDTIETLQEVRTTIKGKRGARINIALGRAYIASDQSAFAVRAFHQALRRDKNNIEAIRGLASAQRKEGKFAEAVETLTIAKRTHEKDPGLYFELGVTYSLFKLPEQAIDALTKATILDPKYAAAYPLLLELLAKNKNAGGAKKILAVLTRASKALPKDVNLQRRFGILAFERRDYPSTISAMKKVIIREPADPDANFYLGIAQHRAGKRDAARESYDALVVVDPKRAEEMKRMMMRSGRPLAPQAQSGLAAAEPGTETGEKFQKSRSKRKRKRGKRKRRGRKRRR